MLINLNLPSVQCLLIGGAIIAIFCLSEISQTCEAQTLAVINGSNNEIGNSFRLADIKLIRNANQNV